ncbi:MAG: right-handed parallel beta-helix repeat-containing protein [Actinomycetota bacterium]|nr:right-handed parallel beta-helix repeat-containing protein [Actinomycetota bacterium]
MVARPNLVVCKGDSVRRIRRIKDRRLRAINLRLARSCKHRHIQDALDAVRRPGTTIYILPGVYKEEPTRGTPKCAEGMEDTERGAAVLTYREQLLCPHAQNLIAIFGDVKPDDSKRECNGALCNTQIEGTGDDPGDVLITGGFTKDDQWAKLNGIRVDRGDGTYFKNFTIELFEFNAIYVLESDGFVVDDVVSRYNDEYGFLTFAVDHGLYKNCESYGNGDAALYPGSASDLHKNSEKYKQTKRWAVEIKNCNAHHNAAGYSGTAGNAVYVHDTRFHHNALGMVTDSVFPNHPGLPQDHGWYRHNKIYSNNINYFENVHSGLCDKAPAKRGYKPPPDKPDWSGTVCPTGPYPVGTGFVIAGGNYNLIEDNFVWDNWRSGFMLISVPAAIRDEGDPSKQFDTSHFNQFSGNLMGVAPNGKDDPNGLDFWWDDNGEGNCWAKNKGGKDGISSNAMDPTGLPTCKSGGSFGMPANPYKQGPLVPCVMYDRSDPFWRDPPGCDFYDTPEEPE